VEKITKTSEPVKPVTTKVNTGHSEAKIIRNPDGTRSLVYPDSDEEESFDQPQPESATDVVKG